MPSQLAINQGPQDSLLYASDKSYFSNVGYTRTSNFQMEFRDVDPQNSPNFGATVQFVIPPAADLLGPVDLMVDLGPCTPPPGSSDHKRTYAAWVETLGYAMIEHMTFSVGSHAIERLTGDQMNIMNELMRTDGQRQGKGVGKTGKGALELSVGATGAHPIGFNQAGRLIQIGATTIADWAAYGEHRTHAMPGKKLIVPLNFFFTKNAAQYFPLAAVNGCNEVRVTIKFRPLNELLVVGYWAFNNASDTEGGLVTQYKLPSSVTDWSGMYDDVAKAPSWTGSPMTRCALRCHYVHLTGPEANLISNQEHVRLLKLWQTNSKLVSIGGTAGATTGYIKLAEIDLSMLHPVQELIITIRKTSEMNSSTTAEKVDAGSKDQKAMGKNYFAYQGGGHDPNVESWQNRCFAEDPNWPAGTGHWKEGEAVPLEPGYCDNYLTVSDFKLTLNGQERHPALASSGLDRDYMMNRLLPMLHSNASEYYKDIFAGDAPDANQPSSAHRYMHQMLDRKEIYVYPFCINPEGHNPSGAVNFSKVSHAKLTISGTAHFSANHSSEEYVVDVHGVHYNWLQIKDGRALTSFA